MSRIVFIDTETTSLRPDRRAWEVGLIVRNRGEETAYGWYIAAEDLDLGNADPFSLKIGRFYDRHPDYRAPATPVATMREREVLEVVETLTRGAHPLTTIPSFDADVLDRRMRANGILPPWHHHIIDIEALAVGYLHGRDALAQEQDSVGETGRTSVALGLPWNSEELSRACGVEPPPQAERHTALGDARWAKRLYDTITKGKQ